MPQYKLVRTIPGLDMIYFHRNEFFHSFLLTFDASARYDILNFSLYHLYRAGRDLFKVKIWLKSWTPKMCFPDFYSHCGALQFSAALPLLPGALWCIISSWQPGISSIEIYSTKGFQKWRHATWVNVTCITLCFMVYLQLLFRLTGWERANLGLNSFVLVYDFHFGG